MQDTKNIIEVLIAIAVGIYLILYYTGYLPLSEEKQAIRQKRIEKHGPVAIMVGVLLIALGIALFVLTIVL